MKGNKYPIASSKKLMTIMKFGGLQIAFLFSLINCVQATAVYGQGVLDDPIEINESGKTLESFMYALEEAADVRFTYSIQRIDIDQEVNYKANNKRMADILTDVLDPLNIRFQVFNNRNIVLSVEPEGPELIKGIAISGTVHSNQGEPVQFANVILRDGETNGKLIKGCVTNEFGEFVLDEVEKGDYYLSVSFVGFVSLDTLLNVNRSIDLGLMTLNENATLLDDVSVTARRNLIIQKIDRLELDVENSMLSSRGTALDVLSSTPGVSVVNDRISMIGKSSVGILLNDKLIDLPPAEVAGFLRSISSEDIKYIEVISTPPAKYEAEGNSGLINIVLKRAARNSWNTSLSAGFAMKTDNSQNIGGNFSYNKNNLSIASSLFFVDGKYNQEQDDYAYFPNALWYTQSPLLSDYQRLNGRVDLSYQLNPKWSIGVQYMRNSTNYLITDNPYTPVFDNETNEISRYLFSTFSQMTWKPVFNSGNLNSTLDLDTAGKKMTVNFDYFRYENEDVRQYIGESVIYEPYSFQHYAGVNDNRQAVDNFSGGLDFDYPLSKANLSFGAKATQSTSTNDILLFNSGLQDQQVNEFPLEENDFTYVEKVQAVYLSLSFSLSEKSEVQLGARAEATQTESTSINLALKENNDYLRLFPTVYYTFQQSERNSYSLVYGRRISRPSFGELNPNVFFINPFQTILGNAYLQPSFTDNLELSAQHGNLTTKVYFSNEENVFSQVAIPNTDNNVITFINENYINTQRIGFSAFHILDDINWWTSSNSFDIDYSVSSFDLETPQANLEGLSSSVSTRNDFSVNWIEGLSLNASYSYTFPGRNYIFNTRRASNLSASIQYLMLDKRLKLAINGNDLFKDSAERLESTVNGVLQTARYYYDSRTIFFSATYNFGNKNIYAKRHRTSNADERNRTGN